MGVSSVFGGLFKNKNDIVSNALTEIVNTMDEGYLEDTFGIKDLYKMASEGSVRMEVSVGADDIMGFYIPVEGKLAFSRDPSNSAVLLEAAAEAASMDLGTMSAYMDDKVIAVAAPEIIDEVFTLNYSDDLAKQLGNSELFDRINMEDKDIEFATSMIADTNRVLAGKEKRFKLKEIYDRYKKTTKAAERLKDAMEVEKAESRKLTINGKEKTYKGYKVRIPSKAIAEFVKTAGKFIATDEELKNKEFAYITQMMTAERMMEGYHYDEARDWAEDKMEMFLDELQSGSEEAEDMVREYLEDIDLLLYVDGKGHAVYLDAECTVDNMTLETEMTFHGGARPMAEMDGEVKLSAGGSRLRLKVERTEESTADSFRSETTVRTNGNGANLKVAASMEYDKKRGDFEFSVRGSSGGMQFQAGIEGAVIDYKKGKSLAVDIDSVSVKAPYFSWSGDLGGHLSIEPLSGKLKAPEGKVFDVIAADEDDWKDVIDEIQSEIYDIESGLSY